MILPFVVILGLASAWNGPCMSEEQMKRFLNFTAKLDSNFDNIDIALETAANNATNKNSCTRSADIALLKKVVKSVRKDTTLNQTKLVEEMCNDFDKTLSNLAVSFAPIEKILEVLEPEFKDDPSHKAITKAVKPLTKAIHTNMHSEPNYPRTLALLQAHTGRSTNHLGNDGAGVSLLGARKQRREIPHRPCLNDTEREDLVRFVDIGRWGVDIAQLSVEAKAYHETDAHAKHVYAVSAQIIHDANEYIVRETSEIIEDMVAAPGSPCSTCKDFFDDLIEVLEAVEDFCLEIASDSSSLEENPIFKVTIDSVDLGISIGNIERCLKTNETQSVDEMLSHPFGWSKYSEEMDVIADAAADAAGVIIDSSRP